jgi:predicted dehydrogenase
VDVVHVAVVNTAHRDAALAMVAGGKAVLVEKTFAMDEAQAREVIAAARQKVLATLLVPCRQAAL